MASEDPSGTLQRHGTVRHLFADVFRARGFLACLILLGLLAATFQVVAVVTGIDFKKRPVPLRKPLDQLSHEKLARAGYEFKHAEVIKGEILDALGTKDYIQWQLVDRTISDTKRPEKYVSLFVTYYTGKPDQVPHVPEQCYLGGGFKLANSEVMEIEMPELGDKATIAVKVLMFRQPGLLGEKTKTVIYTFHANGQFCPDRNDVRLVVGNPLVKYAYFSKLELGFGNRDLSPSKEVAVEAGKRLLRTVVPILVRDHWPDWEAVLAADRPAKPEPGAGDKSTESGPGR